MKETQLPSSESTSVSFTPWLRPPEGSFKLNWDAAIDDAGGQIGIILRDCKGLVIGTLRAQRSLKANSFTAETYAMMLAAIFCREMGVNKFTLEVDALQMVNNQKKPKSDWSQGGLLIEDARHVLNSFADWNVLHTKREANRAAHTLAKDALNLSVDLYDLEETIRTIVLGEKM